MLPLSLVASVFRRKNTQQKDNQKFLLAMWMPVLLQRGAPELNRVSD
jgi:hypothetical protein